jgi:hypothetical protein
MSSGRVTCERVHAASNGSARAEVPATSTSIVVALPGKQ